MRSTLFKQSGVIVVLRGRPQADASDGQASEAKIWHIGIQYLVPFRPTFRECSAALETDFNDEAIAVKAFFLSLV